MRDASYDPVQGTLTWEGSALENIGWSAGTMLSDWIANLGPYMRERQRNQEEARGLARLIYVGPDCCDGEMKALIEVQADNDGQMQRVRSFTLQTSLQWLLVKLCEHAASDPQVDSSAAVAAISKFAGIDGSAVPVEAAARASLLFEPLMQKLEKFMGYVDLNKRHAAFCSVVQSTAPAILTAVEFDRQWQKLPLPVTPSGVG